MPSSTQSCWWTQLRGLLAERQLHHRHLWGFRGFWLLTMVMGTYFVYGQYVEWSELAFTLQSGVFEDLYLLTGSRPACDHRILLMALMLVRSFRTDNYAKGEMGGIGEFSAPWM